VLELAALHAVLVNPAVPLETARVFAALALPPGRIRAAASLPPVAARSAGELLAVLSDIGNDLEAPARTLAPVIDEALATLREAPGCRLARMSGSGPTVFALFDDAAASTAAAARIRGARPAWWIEAAALR
jgi:4-diphosphocytidyl-2-C-methyl-D-erythritol kinase